VVTAQIDHLVVVAQTLEQGAAWCEATLGVAPGPGGRHASMGTHNLLLSIASAAFDRCYLEIIAIDPAAESPGRPRWFGMDTPRLRAAVGDGPRLVHAVARTTAIEPLRRGLMKLGLDPGVPIAAHRDTAHGRLSWRITMRDDGETECAGALPTLIEWQGPHPCDRLAASPVSLAGLALRGVPAPAGELLALQGVDVDAGSGPSLRAALDTPLGRRVLESSP
jgi:Glyoxalase-like domain